MSTFRWEGEATARGVMDLAGLDRFSYAAPTWIAQELLGDDAVVQTGLGGILARLLPVGDRWLVEVQRGLPEPIMEWAVGHELAHWFRRSSCARVRGVRAEEERICDYAGAALAMPWDAFQRRIRATQSDPQQLALEFGTTPTSAALRIGEIEDRPMAVWIRSGHLYVRGPDWFARQPEQVAHDIRHGGPGIRTTTLGRGRTWVEYAADAS